MTSSSGHQISQILKYPNSVTFIVVYLDQVLDQVQLFC
jgi:hypothetical protein